MSKLDITILMEESYQIQYGQMKAVNKVMHFTRNFARNIYELLLFIIKQRTFVAPMKTGSFFFLSISLLLLSINAYGQKVNIQSKAFQQQAGVHLKFTCMLTALESGSKALETVNQYRLLNGILKADLVNVQEDKADLILITNPKDHALIIQNALLKMGFEWVYVDDKQVKTVELFEYLAHL